MSEKLTPEEYEKRKREILAKEPLKVEVSVDTTDIEKIARQKAELEIKLKQEDALTIKLKENLREYNIDYEDVDFKDMEQVTPLIVALREAKDAYNKKAPSGSVPLSDAQRGIREEEEGYDSYEAMIQDIRDKASQKETETEANEILNQLWQKWLKTQQETNKSITYEEKSEKSIAEQINERFRRRKKRDEE